MFYLKISEEEYKEVSADALHSLNLTESNLRWFTETQMRPANNQLWQRAKGLARLDKGYTPYAARIIAKRIYQMLGGTFAAKKKKKR